jgi:hypothetical protein
MKSIKKKIIKPVGKELKEFGKDVVKTGKQLIQGSNDYPPYVKEILNTYGNEIIKSITLKRTPVSGVLTGALSIFSLGKFGERFEKSFDEIFHLFMDITTNAGTRILLEKNERINMSLNPPDREGQEIKQVSNIPVELSIIQMMENTKNRMGNRFFQYDAVNNNCQDFLLNVLQANNIGDQSDYMFIKQDTDKLFKGLPILKKVAHTATELGERGNILMSGGSLQPNPFENERLVNKIRELRGRGLSKSPSQVQSIVFDKSEWTIPKIKKWLKEHNYKYSKADKTSTDSRYRIRQENPDNYSEFRVKNISPSIMLVLGFN